MWVRLLHLGVILEWEPVAESAAARGAASAATAYNASKMIPGLRAVATVTKFSRGPCN